MYCPTERSFDRPIFTRDNDTEDTTKGHRQGTPAPPQRPETRLLHKSATETERSCHSVISRTRKNGQPLFRLSRSSTSQIVRARLRIAITGGIIARVQGKQYERSPGGAAPDYLPVPRTGFPRCRKTKWLERAGHGPACAHGDTACFQILT